MEKDQIAKIVCYALGCVIAYYALLALLPYIAVGLAFYAFGYLVMQVQKNKGKRRH